MTPRRLTLTLYIPLLIVAILHLAKLAVAAYALSLMKNWQNLRTQSLQQGTDTLQDIKAAMQQLETNAANIKGVAEFFDSNLVVYGLWAIVIIVLLVGILQRKNLPEYYADHLTWQRNSILLGFIVLPLIVGWFLSGMLLMITQSLYPAIIVSALISLWFLYRIVYGMWQLHKEDSVYRTGALPPADS